MLYIGIILPCSYVRCDKSLMAFYDLRFILFFPLHQSFMHSFIIKDRIGNFHKRICKPLSEIRILQQAADNSFIHQAKVFFPPLGIHKSVIVKSVQRSIQIIKHEPPSAVLKFPITGTYGAPQCDILVKAHIIIIYIQLYTVKIDQALHIDPFICLLIVFRIRHIIFRYETDHIIIIIPRIPSSYAVCTGICHPDIVLVDSIMIAEIILSITFSNVIEAPVLPV